MESLIDQGIELIIAIQAFSPALDSLMGLFTFMGTIEFYLIFLPIIYWNINPSVGFRTVLLLLLTDTVSSSAKLLFRQPRPYWVSDEVYALSDEASYGAPSSHASDSLAVWGYLAYTLHRVWAYLVFGLVILLIGVSRLYLGVHFPHDVLIGWGIGLIVLLLFIWLEKPLSRRMRGASVRFYAGVGFMASLGVVLAGLLIRVSIMDFPDPIDWADLSSAARSLGQFFTLGGALFGTILGYGLMKRRARFAAAGPIGTKILRYLLGMAGVILVWRGLDILFGVVAVDESTLGLILRYVRYAATTIWALYGAPWLFLRIGLAEEENIKTGG